MAQSLDRITMDPNVCMGQPTIRGMRITVSFILKLLASGQTNPEILEAHPELETEDLKQAMEYAARLAGEFSRPEPSTKG
ncbi:MAG TPA: DUF433 domain-containing protein [Nitrospiria bacterium]|nr:DUF433 domain-containing protein [Nitrospiria bacterium]HUK56347.1 DUF433 domain-containing protein [Nitrospiria bacterium]